MLMRTGCRGDVHKGQCSEGAGRDDSLRVLQVNMTRSGCICVCACMHVCRCAVHACVGMYFHACVCVCLHVCVLYAVDNTVG